MKYQRIKILDQFLNKGLSGQSKWGTFDALGENNRYTKPDEALYHLGFEDYVNKILKLENIPEEFGLHHVYLTMLHSYLADNPLNSFESGILNDSPEGILEFLEQSKRFQLERKYYQSRVALPKHVMASTFMITKDYCKVIRYSDEQKGKLLNPVEGYKNDFLEEVGEMGRIKPNLDLILNGYDKRAGITYKTSADAVEQKKARTSIPYSMNIHPYLFTKIGRYIPDISRKPVTIFSRIAEGGTASEFEVLWLSLLEFHLTEDAKTITEYLEPAIQIGGILSNNVSVAYAVPEATGEQEYFKVVFRYGTDLEILADRDRLKNVMDLRGLVPDEEGGSPIIREEGVTVWDSIFMGAYQAKNGNENDLRSTNLMK